MFTVPLPVPHTNNNALLKVLVYGMPGAGKTTLAASAAATPGMGKVLALSVEGGFLAVKGNPNLLRVEIRNDFPNNLTALQVVETYLTWLAYPDAEGVPEILKGVKTVIIDSLTELLTLTLEAISYEESLSNSKRTIDTTYLNDYGAATKSLKRITRYLKDLPMNIIGTALSGATYTGKGDAATFDSFKPLLTEKLRESVMGYFDHVWYAYAQEDDQGARQFMLQTYSANGFFGKTRGAAFAPAMGLYYPAPSMPKIYKLLRDTETGKTLATAGSALAPAVTATKPTIPAPVPTEQPKLTDTQGTVDHAPTTR